MIDVKQLLTGQLETLAAAIDAELKRRHNIDGDYQEEQDDASLVDCGNGFSFEGESKENLEAELGFKL